MEKCCCRTKTNCECKISAVQLPETLVLSDIWGTIKARCSDKSRMNYKVDPGLYKIGKPNKQSPVFVTGNYKMSLDCLRKGLKKTECWILVIDTKGINVWCAAGKGTFGTEELIKRIKLVNLFDVVSHRRIILPQLGAVGVAAYEVKKETGFDVTFGPVRAKDILKFLNNDLKADSKTRTVKFGIIDRAVLTPMELNRAMKPTFLTLGILFLLNTLGITKINNCDVKGYVGSVLIGTVLAPVLLPYIPARAFSLKGWLLGLVWAVFLSKKTKLLSGANKDLLKASQYMLILPSISALHALEFTGSSTYTSMSGVKKETKIAIPLISISIFIGILLMIKSRICN